MMYDKAQKKKHHTYNHVDWKLLCGEEIQIQFNDFYTIIFQLINLVTNYGLVSFRLFRPLDIIIFAQRTG